LKGAQSNIQPNLVTRDGAIAEGLEKSNMASIRVTGKATGLKRDVDDMVLEKDFNITNTNEKLNEALRMNRN